MVSNMVRKGRIATFKGKHNASKALVLLLLGMYQGSFNSVGIRRLTGLTERAVLSLMWRLHRYRYVTRQRSQGLYVYDLSKRGSQFIEYIPAAVYNRSVKRINKLWASVQ